MIDPIIDWLMKAIPTAYLADVLKLSLVIFSAVQLIKISVRYKWRKPSAGLIHTASVIAAAAAGWLLAPGTVAEKAGLAAVAWLVTFVAAKYGLAIIKWRWPALWAAINLERRRRDGAPPPEGQPDRRDQNPGGSP